MGAWMKLEQISHQVAISGRVRNAQTNEGMAGVRVQITGNPEFQAKIDFLAQLYGADWKQRPDRTITGPDGYFYFLDLPKGNYTLSADWLEAGTRYGSARLTDVKVSRNSKGQINDRDILTIDLPPTSLKGKIKDAKGQDVVMAKVHLEGSSEYTYSDGLGNYSLYGLEAGQKRKVLVNGKGYMSRVKEIALTKGQVQTANMNLVERLPVTNGLKIYLSGESLTDDRWEDLSENQNHATQAENCSIPQRHKVQKHHSKDFTVARFDSGGGLVISDSLNLEKPFTVIVIDRYYDENVKAGRTLQSRKKRWWLGKENGNNGCLMDTSVGTSVPAVVGKFSLSTVTLKVSSPNWYLNGECKGNSGGTTAPGGLGLCKGGKCQDEIKADIACVLIYDRVLSDGERKKVEGWLGEKYGIKLTT